MSIPNNRFMEVTTIFEITCQLAKAMEHLYQNSIIHRDIKPANIILHRSSSSSSTTSSRNLTLSEKDIQNKTVILKLADFGISTIGGSTFATMSAIGTPNFMAPEIVRQSRYGIKPRYNNNADLWSIGVLIFKAVYDKYPSEKHGRYSRTTHLDTRKIDFPYHANGKYLSSSLVSLLCGLLEKDPNKRLSMTEFFQHKFIQPDTCSKNSNERRSVNDRSAVGRNVQRNINDFSGYQTRQLPNVPTRQAPPVLTRQLSGHRPLPHALPRQVPAAPTRQLPHAPIRQQPLDITRHLPRASARPNNFYNDSLIAGGPARRARPIWAQHQAPIGILIQRKGLILVLQRLDQLLIIQAIQEGLP